MNKKLTILAAGLLLSRAVGYANNGAKDRSNPDPDLAGVVVTAETGRPIRDVNITAYNVSAKKERTVVTNEKGGFVIPDLKPGVYKLVFQKDGFEKVIREKMVLRANEDLQVSIQMFELELMFDPIPSPSPLRFTSGD